MRSRSVRIVLGIALTLALIGGITAAARSMLQGSRTHVVAYFDNTNGLFRGDEVRILGVPVGVIESIEPLPEQVRVKFWVDSKYKVPADAKAAIVSPQLITSRAIQLVPAYTSGPVMPDGAVIPMERTAVPVEWDDLRQQLEKLTEALQPTAPSDVSALGAFINTAADNLRGQGKNIRDTIVTMSQALSVLGDHSSDIFGTIRNLSVVVSALQDSASLLQQLNSNLASVTGALTVDPDAVGNAVEDIESAVAATTRFITENHEALGTAGDKLSSISTAVRESTGEIKQALHVFPNVAANYPNIVQPTQAALTGALVATNFANPISFLCGAIQAASRRGAEESAKLCVQYLAPIIKNRQINFPPFGENFFVGAAARPNEITYSEDWLRPDYVPPLPAGTPSASGEHSPPNVPGPGAAPPLPAETGPAGGQSAEPPSAQPSVSTDPSAGLPGMMIPTGGGS
ncbi:mammalian cell entry protein [Mycolicibacterium moriokaense]|nr:MCE family protein [Mycolicibacterium moriokaense]ORB19073.1 mammalian cell entry protein [Mycolicibacterium moriokaense]